MAEKKKKYRRAKKNDLLMPHVADEAPAQAPDKELSEEAQRARDTVAALCRDLFGENAKKAPVQEIVKELPEEDGIVEAVDETEQEEAPSTIEDGDTYADFGEVTRNPFAFAPQTDEVLPLKEQLESSGEDFRLLLDMEYEKELGDAIGDIAALSVAMR